jgi:hypothetical protein
MNNFSKFGTKALLLLFVGMMMNFNHLKADDVPQPIMLKAFSDFGNDIPENFFYLEWKFNAEELEEIDGFRVYKAPGITENEDDFELFEELELGDDRMEYYGNKFAVMLQTFDSAMNYTFYMTAYNENGESDETNYAVARYMNHEKYYVKINNYFPETITANEEVTFIPEVETNFPDPEYSYELIFHDEDEIEGMEIDEETGEITWTPTEKGYYFFGIGVEVTNSDFLRTANMFRVYVSECSELATITLNITDVEGNPIEEGEAILQTRRDDEGNNYGYKERIINGNIVFDNVEKGDYELVVFSYGYFTYWYDGKTGPEDADLLSVDCADDITLDITLEERVEYYLNITNEFAETLKVGEEYTFTPELETNYPDPVYEFELFAMRDDLPEGMEFDEETGTIIWTPAEGGFYSFKLEVKVEDAYYLRTMLPINVYVSECDELATVSVNVNNEDGEPVDSAYAYLISVREDSNIEQYYEALVINGEATFEDVDKGTFYMAIVSYGYYEYWYEGANDYWDATPVEVDCGDKITLDAVLEEKEMPEFYSISGTVTDEETGEPLEFAEVSLIANRNSQRHDMMRVLTDQNGNYTFNRVSNQSEYIVRAEKGFFIMEEDSLFGSQYIPEYYDDVTDISEATVLELDSDLSGIDFVLAPLPEYENSISGTLVGEDSVTIEEGFVVAFLVNADDEFHDHIYFGVTSLVEAGEFTLERLIPGDYIIVAFDAEMQYMPGYYVENDVATMKWREATQITVDEDSEIGGIEVILQSRENMWGGGIVRGRIKKGKDGGIVMGEKPTAEPLNGAMIFLADESGNLFKAGESDEMGQFSIDNIEYGTYRLVADKVGYNSYETTIIIDEFNEVVDADISLQEENITSVEDTYAIDNSMVYPNPASELINVTFHAFDNNSVISLTDVTGHELITRDITTTLGINNIEMNVANFSAGAYFVIIKSGENQISLPVIIK